MKHVLTELINVHYNFNDFNSKHNKICEILDESLITELLDMRIESGIMLATKNNPNL